MEKLCVGSFLKTKCDVGDAAIEVGFLVSVGVMGSWSTRGQVAELSCQSQSECIYHEGSRDTVVIRMFDPQGSLVVAY